MKWTSGIRINPDLRISEPQNEHTAEYGMIKMIWPYRKYSSRICPVGESGIASGWQTSIGPKKLQAINSLDSRIEPLTAEDANIDIQFTQSPLHAINLHEFIMWRLWNWIKDLAKTRFRCAFCKVKQESCKTWTKAPKIYKIPRAFLACLCLCCVSEVPFYEIDGADILLAILLNISDFVWKRM